MNHTTDRDLFPRRLTLSISALFAVLGLAVLAILVAGMAPLLGGPSALSNVMSAVWDPLSGRYGLMPFLLGSLVVSGLALTLAVPFSLGVAVMVARGLEAKLAAPMVRVLAVLAAIPSVVFGWWGLLMVVPVIRHIFGGPGFSLLAAALVLAVMLLPTLSLLFYHALSAVPRAYQEGSDALGATPDQTLLRLVLPCALPGLVQALLVAAARAVGETMAVQMVIGGQTAMPSGLASPGATVTSQLLTDLTVFPPGTRGHGVIDLMAMILMVGMYLLVRASERWGLGR
jgi:phosphate transport system permease protein